MGSEEYVFSEAELDAMWYEEYERMYEHAAPRNVPIRAALLARQWATNVCGHTPAKIPPVRMPF